MNMELYKCPQCGLDCGQRHFRNEDYVLLLFACKHCNIAFDVRLFPFVPGEQSQLTDREQQISELLVRGCTSKEIAEQLNLSKRTVDVHRYNIAKKAKEETNASI